MSTEHAGRRHDLSMHAGCRRNLRGLSAGHSPVGSPFPTPSRRRRGTMTFSLFFSSSCPRLSRKESEGTSHMHPPSPEAEQLRSVRSRPSIPIPIAPLMAHVSLQSCSLTDMSQVSRCTRHGMAAACGCAGHVHICVVRSWVRYDDAQTHQWLRCLTLKLQNSTTYYPTWYTDFTVAALPLRCPRNASPGYC